MSAVAPDSASAEILTNLCKQRQWQAVIEHVRANPANAKAVVAGRGALPPLHVACEKGAPIQVIKVLLTANPSAAQTKSGLHDRLPLHCVLAAASSYPLSDTVVSTLVESFPGACRIADKNGSIPIHIACQVAPVSENIFTTILSMNPEGAYARNFGGMYPLHLAAANKDVKTKKIALAALDRGTLYASISKMTSIRLSKEHETQTKSLEKLQADKLNKMEAHSKEERSKLKAQIESLKSQLNDEKEGNENLREEAKAMAVQHRESTALVVKKEQTKASDMEKELRSGLAEVQLKNMDMLEQLETVQSDLVASNEKVDDQAKEIKGLEQNLEDTTKTLEETKDALESTSKELTETQDHLSSVNTTNKKKSKYILHLENSLKDARESVLVLAKEQERMNAAMATQKEALSAFLLGHGTAMNDAGVLAEKMVGLAANIGNATDADVENDKVAVEEEEGKDE
ncbi:hypothetical protein ACHAXR_009717 [Thalassiosira sp. AJA248-18]